MNQSIFQTDQIGHKKRLSIQSWLENSVTLWIGIVFLGQFMFALYIFFQFAYPFAIGQIDESQFGHMIRGYKNGDTVNNAVLLMHVIPVIVISLSGTLQLVPWIRRKYPSFHRTNGRLFLLVGLVGSVTGLYLTWIVGSRLSDLGAMGVTLNGILIPVMVLLSWKYATIKQFAQHRRFAVHAFILINGVFTFRLYLMGWYMINQGSFGNSNTIDGPADIAISFASYLLPMAIAELVFFAERKSTKGTYIAALVGVTFGALITLVGVAAASMMLWGPRILSHF